MNIKQALSKLDATNDDHWTADGAPRVDAVAELTGDKSITRGDITNAAPDFTRETASAGGSHEIKEATGHAEPSAEGETEAEGQGEGQGEGHEEKVAQPDEVTFAPDPATDEDKPADDALATDGGTDEKPVDQPVLEAVVPVTEPVAEPVKASLMEETGSVATMKELDVAKAALPQLQDALAERSEQMYAAQKVASEAKKTADELADQVNALNRRISATEQMDPNHDTAGVRAFIKQQNANRMARAERLANFIGNSGVNPQELAKELDVRSPIDRAMAGRKAPRGSQRPVLPTQIR